jgi:hypothetical protein
MVRALGDVEDFSFGSPMRCNATSKFLSDGL